ncbi:MAG: MmcQ/YjbR family DNA-binding protein [Gemmatimonadales bacterium]|nr:MAG: MmcQ/YjbR family DNA-binding protein [Gemmatimonadales bacterium]
MTHPKICRDNDPGLAEVREICLGLPDAREVESHGHPTFRTKKIFAVYGATTKGAASGELRYPHSVLFQPDPDELPLLLREERFFVPAYYGPYGWVGLDLSAGRGSGGAPDSPAGPVDWDEARELIEESYRRTAPRRSVARLDAMRAEG